MGRQSARLMLNGKDHKDIFFNGKYHNQMWVLGENGTPTLLWEKYGGIELPTVTDIKIRNGIYYVFGYYAYTLNGARYTRLVYARGESLERLKSIWHLDDVTGNYRGGNLTPTNTGMIVSVGYAGDSIFNMKNVRFDEGYTSDELRFVEIGDLDGTYGFLLNSVPCLIGTRWQTYGTFSNSSYRYKEVGHDKDFATRESRNKSLSPHTLGVIESGEAYASPLAGGFVQVIQDLSSSEWVVPSLFLNDYLKKDLFEKTEDKIIELGYEPISESGSVLSMHRRYVTTPCNTNCFIGSFYYNVEYKYIKNGTETSGQFAIVALLEMQDETILSYKLYDSIEDINVIDNGYYFRFSDVNVITTVSLNWFYVGVGLDFSYFTNVYDGDTSRTYATLHEDGDDICYLYRVYDTELGKWLNKRAKINKYSHERIDETYTAMIV